MTTPTGTAGSGISSPNVNSQRHTHHIHYLSFSSCFLWSYVYNIKMGPKKNCTKQVATEPGAVDAQTSKKTSASVKTKKKIQTKKYTYTLRSNVVMS